MKVIQQTPNQLTLRLLPVGLWMFGGIFTVAGIVLISFLGKVTTLTCHRTELPQSSCRLLTSGLLGSEVREIPVNTLQGAKVGESSDSDGNTYQVVLLTTSGEVPLTSYSSSGENQKQIIASRINQFVGTREPTTLTVQQDDRWLIYLIGGVLTTTGLLLLVFLCPIVTCVFDKTLDTLTLKWQGLFGTKVAEHRLREITDIRVEESTDRDSSTYRVSIILRSGERLPLTRYYSSGKRSKQETADCIRRFLKLNHQISGCG